VEVVLVEVNDLTRFYGDVAAINGVTFEARKGEILGLLGPNAAGKTTTMRILTGFMPPSSGTAKVAGFDIVEESWKRASTSATCRRTCRSTKR